MGLARGPRGALAAAAIALLAAGSSESEAQAVEGKEPVVEFVRSFMRTHVAEGQIPGGLAVVVGPDAPMWMEGFGWANRETRTPMDPRLTRIRVGSVTKLLTATAVVQFAESGGLALDDAVNALVPGVELRENGDRPVLVRDLLTHTSGLGDRVVGNWRRPGERVPPLAELIREGLPQLVLPIGEAIRYSTWGYGLLGLVLEVRAGRSFGDTMRDFLFEPLGMHRSSFEFEGDPHRWVVEYRGASFETPSPRDHIALTPADGLVTTAEDLARFLRFHVEASLGTEGAPGHEAIRAMHRQQYTNAPGLPGIGLGFWEIYRNGARILHHGGSWDGYSCRLVLIPSEHLGLFIYFNGYADELTKAFVAQLADQLFLPAEPASPISGSVVDLEAASGWYRDNWYTTEDPARLTGLLFQTHVSRDSEGRLRLRDLLGGSPASRWLEVSPGLFRKSGDQDLMRFRSGTSGRDYMFIGSTAYERLHWYERGDLHLTSLLVAVLVLVSGFVRGAIRTVDLRGPSWRSVGGAVEWLMLIVCLGLIVLLAGVSWQVWAFMAEGNSELAYGVGGGVAVAIALGATLWAPAGLLMMVATANLMRGPRSRALASHSLVVAGAALLTLAELNYMGLHL